MPKLPPLRLPTPTSACAAELEAARRQWRASWRPCSPKISYLSVLCGSKRTERGQLLLFVPDACLDMQTSAFDECSRLLAVSGLGRGWR
jgi:hypothetical protein